MVIQKMIQTALAIACVLFTLSSTVYAADASQTTIRLDGVGFPGTQLPGYYPSSFQKTGVIEKVGTGGNIVIATAGYQLASNVLVHSPTTEFSSRYDLSAGKEVGFNLAGNGNSNTITEIWILPAGSIFMD